MISRMRLDLNWSDIITGIAYCFCPGNRANAQKRIGEFWSSSSDTVVCIAERSGFDLILETLDLPPGSEILVSALNIRPMYRVIERHGLVAVPIDVDKSTLSMKRDEMERAVNENTKAILAAHLFGSRFPLDDVVEFAEQHGLFVFEDCAQAFAGDGYVGHPQSDVMMVSFGPIKTCSTIMGGILRFKDTTLAKRVAERQARLPLHNRWDYLGWLIRFALLKLCSTRLLFTRVMWVAQLIGLQDKQLNNTIRVFGGKNEFKKFRQQPSYPMLALLERRITRFDHNELARRNSAAETVIRHLPLSVRRPGEDASIHNHWVFPIQVAQPVALMRHLRTLGFDSINGYSSFMIPDSPDGFKEFCAKEARDVMDNTLYLPVHTGMSQEELIQMAEAVSAFETTPAMSSRTAEVPTAEPIASAAR